MDVRRMQLQESFSSRFCVVTGRVILVDGGHGLCNPVYVDDVVQALLLAAARKEAVGEHFLERLVRRVEEWARWGNLAGKNGSGG